MKSLVSVFLLLFLSGNSVYGQKQKAINQPEHLQQMENLKSRANEDIAKNLNRFALNKLQEYDHVLDTVFAAEKRDTIISIRHHSDIENKALNNTSASLKAQIDVLKKSNSESELFNNRLLGRCSIVFLVLLVVFLIILYARKKIGQRYEILLNQSRSKLKSAEEQATQTEKLNEAVSVNKPVLTSFYDTVSGLSSLFDQLSQSADKDPLAMESESGKISELSTLAKDHLFIVSAIDEYNKKTGDEKVAIDINTVCSLYAALIKKASPDEHILTDFEKNQLPPVKMNTRMIGNLLLHTLTNSVQSVRLKASRNIKGYRPQVSISTRLLPRFVQVRIHDNGDGIPDKELEQVFSQFYSVNRSADHSGLGLYISKQIMDDHKGEIKIESDRQRGTDVYLKFFRG